MIEMLTSIPGPTFLIIFAGLSAVCIAAARWWAERLQSKTDNWPWLPFVLGALILGGVGGTKLVLGFSRGRPVGYLTMLLILSFAGLWRVVSRPEAGGLFALLLLVVLALFSKSSSSSSGCSSCNGCGGCGGCGGCDD